MTKLFTKEHEWLLPEGDVFVVGITKYAVEQLGDIIFVETPLVGTSGEKDEDCAVVESVKAASDVYWPISGEIVDYNPAILDDPSLVNADPEGEGWFYKMKATDLSQLDELMSEEEYQAMLKE